MMGGGLPAGLVRVVDAAERPFPCAPWWPLWHCERQCYINE